MFFCFFFSVALSVFAEGQWREKESRDDASACQSSDVISQKHMETLRHICRTHLRCRNTSTLLRSQRQLLLGRQKVFANVGWTFCFFRFLFLFFFFSGFRRCLKLGRFYNFLIFFFFVQILFPCMCWSSTRQTVRQCGGTGETCKTFFFPPSQSHRSHEICPENKAVFDVGRK